jgi:hypothetical protein
VKVYQVRPVYCLRERDALKLRRENQQRFLYSPSSIILQSLSRGRYFVDPSSRFYPTSKLVFWIQPGLTSRSSHFRPTSSIGGASVLYKQHDIIASTPLAGKHINLFTSKRLEVAISYPDRLWNCSFDIFPIIGYKFHAFLSILLSYCTRPADIHVNGIKRPRLKYTDRPATSPTIIFC